MGVKTTERGTYELSFMGVATRILKMELVGVDMNFLRWVWLMKWMRDLNDMDLKLMRL